MKKKKIAGGVLTLLIISFLGAEGPFNKNLSPDEEATILTGETLIKNTESYRKMCISSDNPGAKKAVSVIKSLKPGYFAEVIREYPFVGNENLSEKFSKLVMDIPSYAGIQYYSEHKETWYDLYSSAEILSSEKEEQTETVIAGFLMKPFGDVQMRIISEKGDDYYYYESTNLGTMRYYDRFNCVSPENMKSIIVIFREDDKWILYGVGAVKAPSAFFLRERVETSFMNRIKSFCSHFFEKMTEAN